VTVWGFLAERVPPEWRAYLRDNASLEWAESLRADGARRAVVRTLAVLTVAGTATVIMSAQQAPRAAAATKGSHRYVTTAVSVTRRHAPEYTVRAGDTLSSIAEAQLGASRRWPGLYRANRATIGPNPNVITKGEILRLVNIGLTANFARHIYNVEHPRIVHVAPAPVTVAAAPAAPDPAPAAAPAQAAAAPAQPAASSNYSGAYPGGSFGACVVARESGGNSQVMNSTGHYGLYQFSASTWAAYGGNPGDFGNASVGEQNQVFANALAQGGQSNWSPYDGC
jgi:hypothetical protein